MGVAGSRSLSPPQQGVAEHGPPVGPGVQGAGEGRRARMERVLEPAAAVAGPGASAGRRSRPRVLSPARGAVPVRRAASRRLASAPAPLRGRPALALVPAPAAAVRSGRRGGPPPRLPEATLELGGPRRRSGPARPRPRLWSRGTGPEGPYGIFAISLSARPPHRRPRGATFVRRRDLGDTPPPAQRTGETRSHQTTHFTRPRLHPTRL